MPRSEEEDRAYWKARRKERLKKWYRTDVNDVYRKGKKSQKALDKKRNIILSFWIRLHAPSIKFMPRAVIAIIFKC